jgi:hypothetical protein
MSFYPVGSGGGEQRWVNCQPFPARASSVPDPAYPGIVTVCHSENARQSEIDSIICTYRVVNTVICVTTWDGNPSCVLSAV